MPALIKVLIVFAIIVFANRLKLQLGLSILLGTIVIGLWFNMGVVATSLDIGKTFISPMTILLIIMVVLILILNQLMGRSGQQDKMVEDLSKSIKSKKIVIVSLPALIGLLPMPGGAFFSAPMVGSISKNMALKNGIRTVLNYWFRHIWEFWWPIYPGVILALSITGIGFFDFFKYQIIFTILSLILGYVFILRHVPKTKDAKSDGQEFGRIKDFFKNAFPIFIIFIVMILVNLVQSIFVSPESIGLISKYRPILLGLLASNIAIYISGKFKPTDILKSIFNKKVLELILIILAIMAYKSILNNSGAVEAIGLEMKANNIPILLVIMLLPLISGFVLGVAAGYVGASFPLVVSLIGNTDNQVAYISLAYTMGFVGMMLSPIHFCLVLTKGYFKEDFRSIYKYLLPTSLSLFFLAIAWFFIVT